MDQKMLDQIAKIISPYLKTKHKEKESHELAERIIKEIQSLSSSGTNLKNPM